MKKKEQGQKIYFENEKVCLTFTKFLEIFELEMLNFQGNVVFREKGSDFTYSEESKPAKK